MLTMLLPSMVGLSFLFFIGSESFRNKLDNNNNNSLSVLVFYTFLYELFFNLFIISIPIIFNLSFVSLSILNIDGSLTDLVTIMQSLTVLLWYVFSAYIGVYVIRLVIRIFEGMQKDNSFNKRGMK
jgi:hypothetical protein